MKTNTKYQLQAIVAFILLATGSMPLSGYIGHLFVPTEYAEDKFIGSFLHLIAGLIPYAIGTLLLAGGCKRNPAQFRIGLVGIAMGMVIGFPAVLGSHDFMGMGMWLTMMVIPYDIVGVINKLNNRAEQAVPGYPPQSVGSPEP